jgi:hypothetical protein
MHIVLAPHMRPHIPPDLYYLLEFQQPVLLITYHGSAVQLLCERLHSRGKVGRQDFHRIKRCLRVRIRVQVINQAVGVAQRLSRDCLQFRCKFVIDDWITSTRRRIGESVKSTPPTAVGTS